MNSQQREQVVLQVEHLSVTCPLDKCNTPNCPLHKVRSLPLEERIGWARYLSDQDLEYLITYHQVCLQWMNNASI